MIASSSKNVLILGAGRWFYLNRWDKLSIRLILGYVSETVVEYLSRDPTISLTLGKRTNSYF